MIEKSAKCSGVAAAEKGGKNVKRTESDYVAATRNGFYGHK